jgi:hypothetical protein
VGICGALDRQLHPHTGYFDEHFGLEVGDFEPNDSSLFLLPDNCSKDQIPHIQYAQPSPHSDVILIGA